MQTRTGDSLTDPGQFVIGCNYWASHAGTAMWSDWRPGVIAQDLQQLSAGGLQVLRVFPLWPDFQPLHYLYTGQGKVRELRLGESPLPDDEMGKAGLSKEMMARFAEFANLADKYGLKLLVGLVTGWMSGRLFVPPAFEKMNVLTDPVAIKWQSRFVREFVRQFKIHPAILAWDLGNECNVMAPVPSS
ncbi:MAG: beta-mannanase, partial [Anaerolineae bacterium]|nr:beta-mannanase [Anaerolineae bacterium]